MKYQGLIDDKAGRRYGEWVVVRMLPKDGPNRKWLCRCDCGVEKAVLGCSLAKGASKSCGHERRSRWIGQPSLNRKHGMTGTPTCNVWYGVKDRCLNPESVHFKNYGGRGIRLHPPWADCIHAFIAGVGEKPSKFHQLDRIDNDRGYEPGNVRWVLPEVNMRNTRISRKITVRGETKTVAEWAFQTRMRPGAIHSRLARGMSPEEAVYKPLRHQGQRSDRTALMGAIKRAIGAQSGPAKIVITVEVNGPLVKGHGIEVLEV